MVSHPHQPEEMPGPLYNYFAHTLPIMEFCPLQNRLMPIKGFFPCLQFTPVPLLRHEDICHSLTHSFASYMINIYCIFLIFICRTQAQWEIGGKISKYFLSFTYSIIKLNLFLLNLTIKCILYIFINLFLLFGLCTHLRKKMEFVNCILYDTKFLFPATSCLFTPRESLLL